MIYAYDSNYLACAQQNLGNMLDLAVNEMEMGLTEFYQKFLSSRISTLFSRGDSTVLAGKSGKELFSDVMGLDDKGCQKVRDIILPFSKSPEYWTGWILAYYQWYRGVSFQIIDKETPVETILYMYHPYHEMDEMHAVEELDRRRKERRLETYLKYYRQRIGYTQADLADASGIPLKTIQQYEQGRKNINKASSESIITLANILKCQPIDLMEPQGEKQ